MVFKNKHVTKILTDFVKKIKQIFQNFWNIKINTLHLRYYCKIYAILTENIEQYVFILIKCKMW